MGRPRFLCRFGCQGGNRHGHFGHDLSNHLGFRRGQPLGRKQDHVLTREQLLDGRFEPASRQPGERKCRAFPSSASELTTPATPTGARQCAFATQALGINPNIRVFGSPLEPAGQVEEQQQRGRRQHRYSDNFNPGGTPTNPYHRRLRCLCHLPDQLRHGLQEHLRLYALRDLGPERTGLRPQLRCLPLVALGSSTLSLGQYLGPDLNAAGFTNIVMMPESFADNLTGSATTMGGCERGEIREGHRHAPLWRRPQHDPVQLFHDGGPHRRELVHRNFRKNQRQQHRQRASTTPASFTAASWTITSTPIATGGSSMLNTDDEGLCDSSGNPTKRLYAWAITASSSVRVIVRIGATEVPSAGVSVSAYYSSSTGKVVIVAINSKPAPARTRPSTTAT